MGGNEGTFEYAIDAPWRIEPVIDASGKASYGAIPIQLVVLDENVIPLDAPNRMIGNFCGLDVIHGNRGRHFLLKDLNEIEMTGNGSTTWRNGSWIKGGATPPHATCAPGTQNCTAFQSPHGTSEWYASAWYIPDATVNFSPGSDIMLTMTATFTRTPQIPCTGAKSGDLLTLKNYVSVHAGEAPLPRFKDNRYAYGDLHFHGQGTDNEGESGYNYRGVVRAMGAMGLDFALASEHASDSRQILDVDYKGDWDALNNDPASQHGIALRDMDLQRFQFLHAQLWGDGGANKSAAIDGRTAANGLARPQNVLGHGAAPQIYVGGEVDAKPELAANFPNTGSFIFGNGVSYGLVNLCGGWTPDPTSSCSQSGTTIQEFGTTVLQDVQGFDSMHPARVHMVYMPRDANDLNGFVASRTGVFGGGGRHLTASDGVLPEIDGKGITFLAHPVPGGDCGGGTPNMGGGAGPDIVPYTRPMLDQAFRSKGVLGLELWNEDIRMKNKANEGTTRDMGFESAGGNGGYGMRNDEPKGFGSGKFEMYPWTRFPEPSFSQKCTSMEWTLHHGLKTFDDLLMRGLSPTQTAGLSWLPAGEPRRMFIAGGSDAHGDLNYHRSGYMFGLEQIDDMAIGKPRNLVMAGAPDVIVATINPVIAPSGGGVAAAARTVLGPGGVGVFGDSIKAHSQAQIAAALTAGQFAVTDGPALRIAIDKNGNGVIDDGDIPMGGIVELYGDKNIPLLVEWDSTPEWGPISQIDLVIGGINSKEGGFEATFAPIANGPRSAGTPAFNATRTRQAGAGRNITEHADGYSEGPGDFMRFDPGSLSGHKKIEIPMASLSIGTRNGTTPILPDRFFIRAFARSQPMSGSVCTPDPKVGKCILRYAFANPVWAITPTIAAGTCPANKPRAVDTDGDGLPDGCDPCPNTKLATCAVNVGPSLPPPVRR